VHEEACMFDIMALSEEDLKKVLPKVSVRSLIRLLNAYPRMVSRTFMSILSDSLSPGALEFLRDEIQTSQLPSFPQIREAESELFKIIHEANLFPSAPHG
jgi:hypothetical protein